MVVMEGSWAKDSRGEKKAPAFAEAECSCDWSSLPNAREPPGSIESVVIGRGKEGIGHAATIWFGRVKVKEVLGREARSGNHKTNARSCQLGEQLSAELSVVNNPQKLFTVRKSVAFWTA